MDDAVADWPGRRVLFIGDGIIDVRKYNPLARLGYLDYAALGEVFAMQRPD